MFINSTSSLAVTGSILALMSANNALAAVTPEDVWKNWQAQAKASDYVMSFASEDRQGDRLVIDGAKMELNRDGETARVDFGTLVFQDRGDGTVSVILPESYTMTMKLPETGEGGGVFRQKNMSLIASGSPEEMRHDLKAEEASFDLQISNLLPDEDSDMTMRFDLSAVAGNFVTFGAEVENMTMDFTAGKTRMSLNGTGEANLTIDGSADDLRMTATAADLGALSNPEEMGTALKNGARMDGTFTSAASTFGMFVEDENGGTNIDTTSTSSALEFSMSSDGLRYAVKAMGLGMNLSGDTIPLPEVPLSMAEMNIGFSMPVTETPEPQDFAFVTKLVDLIAPDDIWAMVDPAQTLPRDPATLIIDLAGKARMIGDIFAPDPDPATTSGELHAIEVKELQLKMIGADLTGKGAFTFDNADTETFGGIPRPTGALDMKLIGGNTLLDKAIAMGLLPQEEAMGFRMMMALFARPGEGEDTLVSKIEITPEGAVLANGQRIQ